MLEEGEPLRARGFLLFECVVRRADKGTGLNVLEAHAFSLAFEFRKFIGVDVALDGKMGGRRLQILSES